jgi:pimeloyl-ACP methyl ester carboxylesterase
VNFHSKLIAGFSVIFLVAGVGINSQSAMASSCQTVSGPRCSVDLNTGITMKYVEVGPADGEVVILLHGLTDSVRSWSLAAADLHEIRPDLRIISLDQRGHGQSSLPTGPTCISQPSTCYLPKQMAADVVAFMDAERIEKATIAGHSMGSVIAQEIGLSYPSRVNDLILVATTPNMKGNAVAEDWLLDSVINEQWGSGIKKMGLNWPSARALAKSPLDVDKKAVAWMKQNWDIDPVAPKTLTDKIAWETARVKLQTWLGATAALLTVNNTKRLEQLGVPTLVLWGGQDSFFYEGEQKTLISALRKASNNGGSFCWKQYGEKPLDASGYQIDDLGHNLQWEAPLAVARDISSFLETSKPTNDLTRSKNAKAVSTLVTEQGKAKVICSS